MGATFSVAIVLKGIDRATAPIARVQAAISRARKPIDDMLSSVKRMSDAAGFPKFAAAASDAASAVGNLVSEAKAAALKFAAIGAGVVAVTYKLAESFANYGDEIADTSAKLGISTETLQEWRYAAGFADVTNDQLSKSLFKLSVTAGMANRGNQQARHVIRLLGKDAFDSHNRVKPLADLLPIIADKLSSLENPYVRATLASQMFGKGSSNMIVFLAEGSKGLDSMAAKAKKLGLILSSDDVKAASKLDDGLKDMWKSIDRVRIAIGAQLAPTVTDIAKRIEDWIVRNRPQIERFAMLFSTSLPAALEIAEFAFAVLVAVSKPLIAVWEWLSDAIGPAPALLLVVSTVLVASLIPAVYSTVAAMVLLSGALVGTPVGWVILALTALIAAFVAVVVAILYVWEHWHQFSIGIAALVEMFVSPWEWAVFQIKKAFNSVSDFLNSWALRIGRFVVDKIIGAWQGVKGFFGGLWDWIEDRFTSAFTWIVDKIASFTDMLPDWAKEGLGIKVAMPSPKLGPPIGSPRLAEIAGVQRVRSSAAIKVDFTNVPKGTRVTPQGNDGVDLDLSLGYSMLNP